MTSYKVVQDSNREEFRKYLEKNGVMECLTQCLVSLYEEPERPTDPLEYIRRHLSANSPERLELETLRLASTELKQKVSVMEQANEELKEQLARAGVDFSDVVGGDEQTELRDDESLDSNTATHTTPTSQPAHTAHSQ